MQPTGAIFTDPSIWDDALRLFAALLLAGLIGFEREAQEKSAGLKTHMLFGIGSCLFTILTMTLIERYQSDVVRADPVRIVSAVASGVAFLAAGVVIQSRGRVLGLTTGGSLWMAGAVGLSCGLGEYALAAVSVFATILVLSVVRTVERRVLKLRRPKDAAVPTPPKARPPE